MRNIVYLLFAIFIYPVQAQQNSQLEQLNQRIKHIKTAQQKNIQKKQQLDESLHQAALTINHISLELRQLEKTIEEQIQTLEKLNQEQVDLDAKIKAQTKLLAKHLMVSYELGKYPTLKLLLDQRDPSLISRLSTYYAYINQARINLISKLYSNQSRLTELKASKKELLISLEKDKNKQALKQQTLSQTMEKQRKLSLVLREDIRSQKKRLHRYLQDKKKLETVLLKLAKTSKNKANKPFNLMRHRLIWPAQGKIENNFGKSVDNSELTYNGIRIYAPFKEKVFSIYSGQVVFADWLRGFGLLLIINHGHGYLSLYANNHALFKQKGDNVSLGEIIATVGHSNGESKDSLYFELRKNGRPLDPTEWLRKPNIS